MEMTAEIYKKYQAAMRDAYEAVGQAVTEDELEDEELMLELTVDADRMYMFGGITLEEQKWFSNNVPWEMKRRMFKEVI